MQMIMPYVLMGLLITLLLHLAGIPYFSGGGIGVYLCALLFMLMIERS